MRCDETFFALNNTAHCSAVQYSTVQYRFDCNLLSFIYLFTNSLKFVDSAFGYQRLPDSILNINKIRLAFLFKTSKNNGSFGMKSGI